MNLRSLVAYTDDSLCTVKVSFNKNLTGQVYTYLCEKSIAETLSKNDQVVVDTKDKITVAHVVEVESYCDVDFQSYDIHYRFILSRVNTEYLEKMEAHLKDGADVLEKRRREHLRKQVIEQLAGDPLLTTFGAATGGVHTVGEPLIPVDEKLGGNQSWRMESDRGR